VTGYQDLPLSRGGKAVARERGRWLQPGSYRARLHFEKCGRALP